MAKKTCPHCGASIESNRTVCPNCRAVLQEKSSLTPYLIVGGIIAVIIIIAAVLLLLPASPPTPLPNPQITVPPTKVAEVSSSPPVCTIAIVGSKVPPSSVQLRVMTNTCPAGDVAELRVSVNGVQKETLGTTAGASKTFPATSGTNSVIVVAKYTSGAESVVFQNAAL